MLTENFKLVSTSIFSSVISNVQYTNHWIKIILAYNVSTKFWSSSCIHVFLDFLFKCQICSQNCVSLEYFNDQIQLIVRYQVLSCKTRDWAEKAPCCMTFPRLYFCFYPVIESAYQSFCHFFLIRWLDSLNHGELFSLCNIPLLFLNICFVLLSSV